MTSITNLTCEYRTNPLGIDSLRPRLSWQMQSERPGARQTAYRLLAVNDLERLNNGKAYLWDSGKVESDQSVHVEYDGPTLASRQRVYWRVIVWDERGAANDSVPTWFEMGLLQRSDWQAQWIGPFLRGGAYSSVPAPFLRKSFNLTGPIQSARLYVTALGLYECSLNGRTIGHDLFTPGWTDYHQRLQYQVYDITNHLHESENTIGAILGDGWAVGRVGPRPRQIYFDQPRLLAQLEITLENKETITVVSDHTWKHQFGPLLENDMLHGEAYDARLEMPGWNCPNLNDQDWLAVRLFADPGMALVATNGSTMQRMEALKPISDPVVKQGSSRSQAIFDLGQNMVGRVRLKGSAPARTTVTLRFAEVLDTEGNLYTANLRTARTTDHYTFKGEGEEVWEPLFTFHGFRYVELLNYPGPLNRDTITGIVIHSEMATTGEFYCSEPLLNQLQQNIIWGQKGNFVDVPTDCPQRDERLGWTGDIQVFVRTAVFNMDIAGFMTKWAQDVADAQNEQGSVPAVVPNVLLNLPDGGPAWADAVIICPWNIYLAYGDKRVLENNYATMSRFMQFIIAASPDYIRCAPEYQGWPGFGDWLSIHAHTPRELIGTAFLAYDAHLMAQIAAVLGREEEAATYRQLFAEVKTAFAHRYLAGSQSSLATTPLSALQPEVERADTVSRGNLEAVDQGPISSQVFNTDLFTPTQTAYVLALHFDLLPEELRPLATAELVADIERRQRHLSTGFVGAPYLPHVLSNNGRLDIAYALLGQKTWPSWLYPVTQGATTIWERWDGWTAENGFQNPGMNSFNHYAYGSIGAWLYNTVAGIEIDPAQPGYKHIILRPQPGGELTQASGKLKTPYGELLSAWQLEQSHFEWLVLIPPNSRATTYLPVAEGSHIRLNGQAVSGLVHQLGAGTYRFMVEPA